MPRIIKAPNNLRRERNVEYTAAENIRLKAQLDYVAMMADIELPEDDTTSTDGMGNESEVLEG